MANVRCKICGGASKFFASVRSGKHCNLQIPEPLPPDEVEVEYYRCLECDFIFTTFLDSWSARDLQRCIYNDDYVKVDPLYPKIRPENNARFLKSVLHDAFPSQDRPRVLDYGAGNGLLSRLVRDDFAVENYDLLNPDFDVLPPGPFDLIFSSEVVEHMPFPKVFLDQWSACLAERGCVIFSTKLQPSDIEAIRGDWWYLGPRNGHVSIFSRKSLEVLFAQGGLLYESLTDDWHLAYRRSDHLVGRGVVQRNLALLPTGFITV